jgi:hypothetical protein
MAHQTTVQRTLVKNSGRIIGLLLQYPTGYFDEVIKPLSWPLSIKMPCGVIKTFHAPEQLPKLDMKCPCGDPRHWLFKRNIIKRDGGNTCS